jgi:acyl carrier protein
MFSTEEVIVAAVRKIKPSLTETELPPATRFDKYNISSLEMAMIVFEINDYYEIDIEPYTLMTLACIGDAVKLVDQLVNQRAPRLVAGHG